MTPYLVVEGTRADVLEARRELEAKGWELIDGWLDGVHPPGRRVVAVGDVATTADASAALLAALAGAGVLIAASAEHDVIDRLCDDLRRLGPVDHRVAGAPRAQLTADQLALLGLLADGATLGQAARQLHLSRRTADRRLAAARCALAVTTTAEAVRRARHRGTATA